MAYFWGKLCWLIPSVTLVAIFLAGAHGVDIFLDWNVAVNTTINPVLVHQPVITINGVFPGPLLNLTTNDLVHVNVFNNLDEPLLFTWNGIQHRLNSWQDGVSGTNCPILPGKNWTYVFQAKDQIGSFFYFPSINFQKASGGYGPIRVNNRIVIAVPFPKPEAEFDLLVGDWFYDDHKKTRSKAYNAVPDVILMNGKGPFRHPQTKAHESFTVKKGMIYRFRISNVGSLFSFNFRIQKHKLVLVEAEGSYTNQITLDSLDVHVGQSYSVLVTADQDEADYYIIASPKFVKTDVSSSLVGVGVLHYSNANTPVTGSLPPGPDPFDVQFSVNQAKAVRWNLTAGAARPNPQGTFNVTNATLSQTFILQASKSEIKGVPRYVINNVSYVTVETPVKLADHFVNGSGVYKLDWFPTNSVINEAAYGVSVVTGNYRGWIELVFVNKLDTIDSWHLDGFSFHVVGFGTGQWAAEARTTYNLIDPIVRSTVQVYPGGWTAVYAFLDSPGMWNLRSQLLRNWYLGQELYIRVHKSIPGRVQERPPPPNLLVCGKLQQQLQPAPAPAPLAKPANHF